jgi:excisionase family DNA binding protein
MDLVSIDDAAQQMGLHPSHLRRLVRNGEIPGRKVGAHWLVSEAALRQRERLQACPGRPLSAPMAWAVMKVVDTGLQGSLDSHSDSDALGDRRFRFRLRRHLQDSPPAELWPSWLRRRSSPRRVWVHPGVKNRLASDPRLYAGGENGAAAAEIGLGAWKSGSTIFYVSGDDVQDVMDKYKVREDPDGQVTLMVVSGEVSGALLPQPGEPVSRVVVLVDLLESPDARQRHLAKDLITKTALDAKTGIQAS